MQSLLACLGSCEQATPPHRTSAGTHADSPPCKKKFKKTAREHSETFCTRLFVLLLRSTMPSAVRTRTVSRSASDSRWYVAAVSSCMQRHLALACVHHSTHHGRNHPGRIIFPNWVGCTFKRTRFGHSPVQFV